MCAAYGWTPDVVGNLTSEQVEYFLAHVPELEARRAFPFAHLEATILNMMGGKGDVDEHGNIKKPEKPPKPDHLLWTAEERMAAIWYARFSGSEQAAERNRLSVAAARDILDNISRAPAWALHLLPIEEAKRVLSS